MDILGALIISQESFMPSVERGLGRYPVDGPGVSGGKEELDRDRSPAVSVRLVQSDAATLLSRFIVCSDHRRAYSALFGRACPPGHMF
jgi:hypothetical protein